jgi:glycosyl transferase family 25
MLDLNLLQKFVINLKRRPDRLELFRSRCPLRDYTVIHGFDGKYSTLEKSKEEIQMLSKFSRLRPGEEGVFISHLRIFQKIVTDKIPFAFIMEDDAIFCPGFSKKCLEVLSEIPHDTDILYIGGRFTPDFVMDTSIKVSKNIVKHKRPFNPGMMSDRTTHAYIVSNKMAGILVKKFELTNLINTAFDDWILRVSIENSIDIYNANPLLCYSPAKGDSDIR